MGGMSEETEVTPSAGHRRQKGRHELPLGVLTHLGVGYHCPTSWVRDHKLRLNSLSNPVRLEGSAAIPGLLKSA